jgi:hypothetical protein
MKQKRLMLRNRTEQVREATTELQVQIWGGVRQSMRTLCQAQAQGFATVQAAVLPRIASVVGCSN